MAEHKQPVVMKYGVVGEEEGVARFENKDYLKIPSGSSENRPLVPEDSMLRYNTDNNQFEGYANGTLDAFVLRADLTQAIIDALVNTNFSGSPTVDTPAFGDYTNKIANTIFVQDAVMDAVTSLVNASPLALDTLKEIATALGNDANFATTMTTALGNRLRFDVDTQGLTSTQKTNARTNLGLATVSSTGSFSDLINKPTITNSFNTRTGAVVLTASDVNTALGYTAASDAAVTSALALKAGVDSPTFIGLPVAPTAADAANSNQIATTAFVKNQGYITAEQANVKSVFGRSGDVLLLSSDVVTALGFTPYNATNPNNYINSAGAPVQSVFGRSGEVSLTAADIVTALGYTSALVNTTRQTADVDTFTTSGIYALNSGLAHEPTGSGFGTLLVTRSSDTITQLYFGVDGTLWSRANTGDTLVGVTWKKNWDSSNLINLNQLTNGPGYLTAATLPIATASVLGGVKQGSGITIDADGSINITGSSGGVVLSFNGRTEAVTLTSADVTGALSFTPYNATNPAGYISGINSGMVTTALGFTPYDTTNPAGYITSSGAPVKSVFGRIGDVVLQSSDISTALGYTPGLVNITRQTSDLDTLLSAGTYALNSGLAHEPTGSGFGTVTVTKSSDITTQLYGNNAGLWYRGGSNNTLVDSAWSKIWTNANLTNVSQLSNDAGYITIAEAAVQSVAGKTGAVVLTASDVGLGNVNNTTDLLKPISTATQTALNLKFGKGANLTGTPDLNTYTTTGWFPCSGDNIAAAGTNFPVANAGVLEVLTDGVFTYQTYTIYSGGSVYKRTLYNSTWSGWRTMLDTGNLNIANYAPLSNPALTGTPTSTTAAVNTNNTQIATTAFVQAEIANDAPTKTGGGASGTWSISVVGSSNRIFYDDTRAVNDLPSAFFGKTKVDFKSIANVGNPPVINVAGYAHIMTVSGYQDASGGMPIQLSFGDGIALRKATDASTWGVWRTILHDNNFSTYAQPKDADLTAIAALSGTSGILKKTAADTWSLDTTVYITSEGAPVQSVAGRSGAVVLTSTDVGLGSVTNTSDANKPVSTAQQTALDLKANIASPTLTGTPTAPTAVAGTNTTQIATTAFVGTAVANLVASSPSALDTLNELATALGNDPNFATTMTNSLSLKAPLASPTFTGTATIPTLKVSGWTAIGGTADPLAALDIQGTRGSATTSSKIVLSGYGTTDQARIILNHNSSDLAAIGTNATGGWWIGKCDSPYDDSIVTKYLTFGTDGAVSVPVSLSVNGNAVAPMTATVGGLVPTPPNDSTKFLSGDGTWDTIVTNSAGTITRNKIVAISGQTIFNVPGGYAPNLIDIDCNGSTLVPGEDFTATNGTTYTLTVPATAGEEYVSRVFSNQSMAGTTRKVPYSFVATDGQTTFNAIYSVGLVDVFVNGYKMTSATDFNATDGASVVFTSGLVVGSEVLIDTWQAVTMANSLSTSGGSIAGDVSVSGTVTANKIVSNAPVFIASGSGVSTPNAVSTTQPVAEVTDTANAYNAATGEFTAPVAGFYQLNAYVNWGSANATGKSIMIVVDGAQIAITAEAVTGTGQFLSQCASGLVYMAVGSKAKLTTYLASTGPATPTVVTFSGFLARAV